jgi:replicative DNA helicase
MAVLQVIGCLTKAPYLLLDDRYPLIQDDFPERFHKIVFTAVENLIKMGAQEITSISVDHYLANYPKQYKVFTDNDGMDYLDRASAMSEVDNYDFYYTVLKKFALLQQLDSQGFDVRRVYDASILNVDESEKMQRKFDEMSLEDIINQYELPLAELRQLFSATGYTTNCQAGESLDSLIEEWQRGEDFGVSCFAQKFNTIVSVNGESHIYTDDKGKELLFESERRKYIKIREFKEL